MFGFFSMADNYEDRIVAYDVINNAKIDTVSVTDSDQPYETGIAHKQYNGGAWVIVELYDDLEASKVGHKKWIDVFSNEKLPEELKDVSTSEIAKFVNDLKIE